MGQRDETSNLISATRVAGTEVYNGNGDHLGEVHDVMIDKTSGKITYALMSFGGFLGIGEKYHPLPWESFHYDTRQGGYVVNLSKDQLQSAPIVEDEARPWWGDRAYEQRIHDYYKVPPYWGI